MARQIEIGEEPKAEPKRAALSESAILGLLAARYPEPRHVLLPHVRNATGWKGQRTADAVVFEMWPMDGLHLIGFEVKSSRSDWLAEVKRPLKREAVAQFCDQWIIVAGSEGIVRPNELRPTDGLLVAGADGLTMKVKPADVPAQPVTREFLCAAVRRALACSPHGAAVKVRAKELSDVELSRMRQRLRIAEDEARRLRVRLENIEDARSQQPQQRGENAGT